MTLPVDYNTGTVTGNFVGLNGLPIAGTIEFTAVATRLVSDATDTVIIGRTIVVSLSDGSFEVDLPATDDPDISPTGFTYRVVEKFTGGGGLTYFIDVPVGTTTDLSDVTPVDPETGSPVIRDTGNFARVDEVNVFTERQEIDLAVPVTTFEEVGAGVQPTPVFKLSNDGEEVAAVIAAKVALPPEFGGPQTPAIVGLRFRQWDQGANEGAGGFTGKYITAQVVQPLSTNEYRLAVTESADATLGQMFSAMPINLMTGTPTRNSDATPMVWVVDQLAGKASTVALGDVVGDVDTLTGEVATLDDRVDDLEAVVTPIHVIPTNGSESATVFTQGDAITLDPTAYLQYTLGGITSASHFEITITNPGANKIGMLYLNVLNETEFTPRFLINGTVLSGQTHSNRSTSFVVHYLGGVSGFDKLHVIRLDT